MSASRISMVRETPQTEKAPTYETTIASFQLGESADDRKRLTSVAAFVLVQDCRLLLRLLEVLLHYR